MEEIPNQSKMERGSHGLRRNAGFDGGFNGDKFFVFQNGRHGGENNRPRTAMKSQFFNAETQRRKVEPRNTRTTRNEWQAELRLR
jgi:hypothetical protein